MGRALIDDNEVRRLKSEARFGSAGTGPTVDDVWLDHTGNLLRVWEASLERVDDELIIVRSLAKNGMRFEDASFEAGDHLIQYIFRRKWFCIDEFRSAAGNTKYRFCHISRLSEFTTSLLVVQDLILDILVKPNGKSKLVDLDEYRQRSAMMDSVLKLNIEKAKEELLQMIQSKHFPFNYSHS